MTTEVKTIFCDNLSQPNEIYNTEKIKESSHTLGGVSFVTKRQTWAEPVPDAIKRVVNCFGSYFLSHPEVFLDMRLYLFATVGPWLDPGPVARYKKLWKGLSEPFQSVSLALRQSEEIEIVNSIGTSFAGLMELPTGCGLPDLRHQMRGFQAFYILSKDDLIGTSVVERLFNEATAKDSLDWGRMLVTICSERNFLIRGSGGFDGDPEVALDIFGALEFPR